MTPQDNDNRAYGGRIRAHRRSLPGGLNQTEYGERYGVNQTTVSNWERGIYRPDGEHLPSLTADGFNPDEAISLTADEEPRQLSLPFGQRFWVELRIGPQSAGAVAVNVRLRRMIN